MLCLHGYKICLIGIAVQSNPILKGFPSYEQKKDRSFVRRVEEYLTVGYSVKHIKNK
jgi:hypothetical protein